MFKTICLKYQNHNFKTRYNEMNKDNYDQQVTMRLKRRDLMQEAIDK